MEQDKTDVLKILLEQSWLHIRHAENHRLWFTNMYFLAVAGVLAYLSTQAPTFVTFVFPTLAIFLLVLAILGLIVCLKVDKVQKAYIKAIENILKDTFTEKNDFRKYLGYLQLKKPKGIWEKVESVSFTYKVLYITSIILWSILFTASILTIIN